MTSRRNRSMRGPSRGPGILLFNGSVKATWLRCAAAAHAIAAVACRGHRPEAPAGSGNRQPASAEWPEATAWRVGEEPSLDLTRAGSGPAHEFYDVAGLCWSGRYVVVADGGSGTIRLYALNGEYVRTFGGNGGGPGEFSALRAVYCTGSDTITAFDVAADRVNVFSMETGVLRTTRLASLDGHRPVWVFPLTDGGWLGTIELPAGTAARASGETRRNTAVHVRYSGSGAVRDTVAVAPGQEFVSQGGGLYTIPLYSFQAVQTVHDDTLYALTADSFEISVFSLDGHVQRTITRSGLDLSVSREEAAAKIEEVFRRRTGSHAGGAVMSSRYPFPLPRTKPPM